MLEFVENISEQKQVRNQIHSYVMGNEQNQMIIR